MSPALTAKGRKLLPLVGSSLPGETLAASAALDRVLKAEGLGWCGLAAVVARVAPPGLPDPPITQLSVEQAAALVAACIERGGRLKNPRDGMFLFSLRTRLATGWPATPKQERWLFSIAHRLKVPVVVV